LLGPAIYRREGERLRIASAAPGGERPQDFEPRPGIVLFDLKREPAPDPEPAVAALRALNGRLVFVQGERSVHEADLSRAHLAGTGARKAARSAGDADLVWLEELPGLRVLRLSGTAVTDGGLEQLRGLAGLHTLDLSRTAVSDRGLVHLQRLTALQTLDLRGTCVTDEGVDALRRALEGEGGRALTILSSVDRRARRVTNFNDLITRVPVAPVQGRRHP
jgi:hypothetical protein